MTKPGYKEPMNPNERGGGGNASTYSICVSPCCKVLTRCCCVYTASGGVLTWGGGDTYLSIDVESGVYSNILREMPLANERLRPITVGGRDS